MKARPSRKNHPPSSSPSSCPHQCLPCGDTAGHRGVRTHQPQGCESGVALFAAEPYGSRDEDDDRHHQHRAGHDDEQQQGRSQGLFVRRTGELGQPRVPLGLREAGRALVEGEFGGPGQAFVADGADDRGVETLRERLALRGVEQLLQRG